MRTISNRWLASFGSAALGAALVLGCGDDGGGGSGTSRIQGNVSSAPTASLERSERSWFAWVREEVVGFARRAFAQAGDVGGIEVGAGAGGDQVSTVTDDGGDFDLPGAPTGDVTVTFRRGSCRADETLTDVTADSTINLEDVDFNCGNASARNVHEVFQAVVRNVPSSPQGNLNVCVNSGGTTRARTVDIKQAEIQGGPLEPGDFIEAEGDRAGLGAPSNLKAERVTLLGEGSLEDCLGVVPTETPTPAGSPAPTATPTGSPEATATPTATPTP